MEEQQSLLGDRRAPADLEGGGEGEGERSATWKQWTAENLESRTLHKWVIAFISVDAACVLADLFYTFLSDSCGAAEDESPLWLEVLSHISLAITTLFLIEIPLALFAFGPRYYRPLGPVPHASLHFFDATIILTTFVLEVVLRGRERELAGLLILLRLWRLVKLVGGLAVGAGELNEDLSKQLAETEQRLSERSAAVVKLQEENKDLRARLALVADQ